MNNTYLSRHDIKGQKWGDRRNKEKLGHIKNSQDIRRETFDKIIEIHNSLSKKEKKYLGDMLISKYTKYINIKNDAYITLDDYGDKYKNEHPYKGKIISIAASTKSRGTGDTDWLVKQAIKDNPNSRLIAEIDSDNDHSINLFTRNGFKQINDVNGIKFYVYDSRLNNLLKKLGHIK